MLEYLNMCNRITILVIEDLTKKIALIFDNINTILFSFFIIVGLLF